MAKELIEARERLAVAPAGHLPSAAEIAELRQAVLDDYEAPDPDRVWVSGWAERVHGRPDGGLVDVIDTLAAACARITELEQNSLGYVIVLRNDEGELTCCDAVFDADGARTAEGIRSGYAPTGEAVLIAELREVSDRA
ncbi:hypothetical protein [Nocardia sp. CC227C]|uniref:hypothetical protein n=1 Tax=Nocardia sp. CC227C TaxID=3044562 RepID=UPI00278C4911|nr:hypothetical protein [Nocardia sp. CC227C]